MSGLLDDDGDEPDANSGDDGDDLLGGTDDGLMGDDPIFEEDDSGDDSDEELSYRLDEIEKEIDSLEGKVETVRGENEKISDSIETVERNVDRLVDMYEIVTQGINPFVGDQEIGNAFETATGEDGIFGGDDPADDIDENITNAEAEDFLEDDLEDNESEAVGDFDESFEEEDEQTFDDDFEELDDGTDEGDDTVDEFDDETEEEWSEIEDDPETEADRESNKTEPESDTGPDSSEITNGPTESAHRTPYIGENGEMGDHPYLVRHPSRPDVEILTLEWLKYLIETAGIEGAEQTLAYYESVDWISESVETYLQSLLNGFSDSTRETDEDPKARSVLSPDEHKRSLQYIARIATPEKTPNIAIKGTGNNLDVSSDQ